MKKNQQGFGVVGVICAVLLVGVVAGAGWYLVQRQDTKKPNTAAQTVSTKSYTDSAKLYSLKYPSGWTVTEESDCCSGVPKDYTKVSRSVTFAPRAKTSIHGYGFNVQADKTDALAKIVQQGWQDNKHVPEAKKINGYDAQYVKVTFNGDAEHYVDHNYLLTYEGASVFVTFRESYYHQYPAEDWSATQDMGSFTNLLHSIKFLN